MLKLLFRLLFVTALALTALPARAADDEASDAPARKTARYYMEIVVSKNPNSRSASVALDLGRLLPSRLGIREDDARKATQSITFTSVADALNYLGAKGWEPLDSYTAGGPGSGSVHIVMMAETDDPQSLATSLLGK